MICQMMNTTHIDNILTLLTEINDSISSNDDMVYGGSSTNLVLLLI